MLEGCTPWPEDLARRYRAEGYWQGLTLGQVLDEAAGRFRENVCVVHADRRLTYRELAQDSEALALGLVELGLEPRDRVVLQLPNSPDFLIVFFALMRIGVIPVMALPPHRHTEIDHFVGHSGATAMIVADTLGDFDYRTMAAEMADRHPRLAHVVVVGDAGPGQHAAADLVRPLDEAAKATLAARAPAPDEVALMLLSGGTTALPKLIPRTHDDYHYNSRQSGVVCGFGEDTVFLAVLPMAHNYTLASPGVLATIIGGGRTVIAPGTGADAVFGAIAEERVSVVAAAVPLIARWVNDDSLDAYDTTSLRLVQNGGARLAPELRRRLQERFQCRTQEIFGTAEGLLNMTRLDDGDERRLTSSGAPVSPADEIRVVDDAGREVAEGTAGELLCRGPYTIHGYYDAPAINAEAFSEDGFYRMGDVVRVVDGYIYAEGRKKDLINRGGEKISCEEVENLILSHAAVDNVCLVAMPDPVFGEKACAFVIVKPGQTLSFEDLTAFLLGKRIAKFKLPERLEVVDAFPISPAGKIMRRKLREAIEARIAAEGRATDGGAPNTGL